MIGRVLALRMIILMMFLKRILAIDLLLMERIIKK